MSVHKVSGDRRTMVELIAAGDADAAAGFYDARAPSVREYCTELCPPDRVDEAILTAFADLLGRIMNATPAMDADELLRRSTRTAAAARMDLGGRQSPTCAAVPELIATKMNGEFPQDSELLRKHLGSCRNCRRTAERLEQAEDALIRTPQGEPSEQLRALWLELVAREEEAETSPGEPKRGASDADETAQEAHEAAPQPQEPEPEPQVQAPEPEPPAQEPEPEPQVQTSPSAALGVRQRSGGIVGAARRLTSSTRKR